MIRIACLWQYFVVSKLFLILKDEYQWILGIALLLIREFNCRILTKVCYKSASCESDAIKITCLHEMGCRHAVFFCVALATLATTPTSFLMLAFDFIINFWICVKIICDKKKEELSAHYNVKLQQLALKEKAVFIVPLTYYSCFLLAYYGPNAGIIGNVKNTSWHYRMVQSLAKMFLTMGVLLAIHIVSIALWTLLLKKTCNIKFFDGYMQIQKNYWLIMAVQEAYALNEVKLFM